VFVNIIIHRPVVQFVIDVELNCFESIFKLPFAYFCKIGEIKVIEHSLIGTTPVEEKEVSPHALCSAFTSFQSIAEIHLGVGFPHNIRLLLAVVYFVESIWYCIKIIRIHIFAKVPEAEHQDVILYEADIRFEVYLFSFVIETFFRLFVFPLLRVHNGLITGILLLVHVLVLNWIVRIECGREW